MDYYKENDFNHDERTVTFNLDFSSDHELPGDDTTFYEDSVGQNVIKFAGYCESSSVKSNEIVFPPLSPSHNLHHFSPDNSVVPVRLSAGPVYHSVNPLHPSSSNSGNHIHHYSDYTDFSFNHENAPVLPMESNNITNVLPSPILPSPVLPSPVLPSPVLPSPVLPSPGLPSPVRIIEDGNMEAGQADRNDERPNLIFGKIVNETNLEEENSETELEDEYKPDSKDPLKPKVDVENKKLSNVYSSLAKRVKTFSETMIEISVQCRGYVDGGGFIIKHPSQSSIFTYKYLPNSDIVNIANADKVNKIELTMADQDKLLSKKKNLKMPESMGSKITKFNDRIPSLFRRASVGSIYTKKPWMVYFIFVEDNVKVVRYFQFGDQEELNNLQITASEFNVVEKLEVPKYATESNVEDQENLNPVPNQDNSTIQDDANMNNFFEIPAPYQNLINSPERSSGTHLSGRITKRGGGAGRGRAGGRGGDSLRARAGGRGVGAVRARAGNRGGRSRARGRGGGTARVRAGGRGGGAARVRAGGRGGGAARARARGRGVGGERARGVEAVRARARGRGGSAGRARAGGHGGRGGVGGEHTAGDGLVRENGRGESSGLGGLILSQLNEAGTGDSVELNTLNKNNFGVIEREISPNDF